MAQYTVPSFDTIEEVRPFFDQCVAFWQRKGDDIDVARCKAFWWDIVEIANNFDRWTPGKEQFVMEVCAYKPGMPVPCEANIRAGNALPGTTKRPGKRNSPFPSDRIYTVTFVREQNNMIDHITFHCWAANAQEAKCLARESWETRHTTKKKTPHMFHLEARRAVTQNTEDLRVTNWMQRDITGWDTMWTFILTRSVRRGGAWT